MTHEVNVSVIYDTSTGTVFEVAQAVAEGVQDAPGKIRLLKVTELVPDEIAATNNAWSTHAASTEALPTARTDIPADDAARNAARHRGRRVVTTTRAFLSGRVLPQDAA